MDNPVIVSTARTAIGRFLGTLAPLAATELGARVVTEVVKRAGIEPGQVDEVVMGNVVGAGLGQNPARQAALGAGIPDNIPAMTVNKVCGSGLKSVVLGAQAIKCGDAELVVAGGMESMSNAPYLVKNARGGFRMGHQKTEGFPTQVQPPISAVAVPSPDSLTSRQLSSSSAATRRPKYWTVGSSTSGGDACGSGSTRPGRTTGSRSSG